MKKYELNDKHRAELGPWVQCWIDNAMATGPYSDEERASGVTAMRGLYAAANLEPPRNEVFVPSPICGALSAGIAAGVWFLRDHPERHAALFGRAVTEAEIEAGRVAACALIDRGVPLPTRAATSAATDAATRAATDAATRAATDVATYDGAIARFLIGCTDRSWQIDRKSVG